MWLKGRCLAAVGVVATRTKCARARRAWKIPIPASEENGRRNVCVSDGDQMSFEFLI